MSATSRIASLTVLAALLAGCSSGIKDGINSVDCEPEMASEEAIVLLSDSYYGLGGWNHVNGTGSFETVALEPRDYAISADNYLPDPTCGDAKVWSAVLAKRTWDWDRNHGNGIEAAMRNPDVTFADIDHVTLILRLNSDRTSIPTTEQLDAHYNSLLTADQIAELDNQHAHLELTLFGTFSESPFMNASVMISVDPEQFADQWISIRIPRDDLVFYTEADYARTTVGDDQHQDHRVQGLRINPETSSGLTARHFIGDSFDPTASPELFKEMAFDFALIEVGLAPTKAS